MNDIKRKLIEEKEDEYREYIKNHINSVKYVWKTVGVILLEKDIIDDFLFNDVCDLINTHDMSKYKFHEFDGYRKYFYPIDPSEKCEYSFNQALRYHIKNNPHHWNHWVVYDKNPAALSMPIRYVFEMLCDWTAMSIKFNNKPSDWYTDNAYEMLLHHETESLISSLLPIFDKVFEETQ